MIHSLQKVTILLTALALPVTLASPSPEPCSDHPGVVHDPSSPYFTGGTAAKIQNPWTDSSSSSSSAAPQTDSSPSSSSSSDSSNDSPSWYQNASPPAKVETPTATDAPTVGTVTDGASQAVGQFAPYLPADLAGPLQSGTIPLFRMSSWSQTDEAPGQQPSLRLSRASLLVQLSSPSPPPRPLPPLPVLPSPPSLPTSPSSTARLRPLPTRPS